MSLLVEPLPFRCCPLVVLMCIMAPSGRSFTSSPAWSGLVCATLLLVTVPFRLHTPCVERMGKKCVTTPARKRNRRRGVSKLVSSSFPLTTWDPDRTPTGVWFLQVEVGGEVYQNAEGGGQDYHTFGVGGALCGMSDCYRVSLVQRQFRL